MSSDSGVITTGVAGYPSRNEGLRRIVRACLNFCRRQPLGAFGAAVVIALVIVAIAAPLIAPYGENETSLIARLQSPSASHWFGTDELGRDVFSRIIFGTRTTVTVAGGAVLIALCFSVVVGTTCGYAGGLFDVCVQRVVDAVMSFPTLVLLLSLVAVLGIGTWQVVSVLALIMSMGQIRVIRSATLMYRDATFVDSAKVVGASPTRIVALHVFPNLFGPLMVVTTLGLSTAVLAEAALSFLGFGVPPPAPSWGRMLSGSAAQYIYNAPWMAIFPGLAITFVVFSVNMLGDALRDEMDPRLRGSR